MLHLHSLIRVVLSGLSLQSDDMIFILQSVITLSPKTLVYKLVALLIPFAML